MDGTQTLTPHSSSQLQCSYSNSRNGEKRQILILLLNFRDIFLRPVSKRTDNHTPDGSINKTFILYTTVRFVLKNLVPSKNNLKRHNLLCVHKYKCYKFRRIWPISFRPSVHSESHGEFTVVSSKVIQETSHPTRDNEKVYNDECQEKVWPLIIFVYVLFVLYHLMGNVLTKTGKH